MQSQRPFGFTQPPFVSPASREQAFLAPASARSVAALLDAVMEGRRVIGLSGAPGVGKTVLLGVAIEELRGWDVGVIRAAAPLPGPHGFQQMIGDAAGVHGAGAMEPAMLARAIAATGRTAPLVLAVDDAHTLGAASLQYLWLLASLLGFGPVKLQIMLVGRMELDSVLLAPELAPLRQAVGATRLALPFGDTEAVAYLDHKVRSAGSTLGAVLSDGAVSELLQQAAGLPGAFDLLASRALAADKSSGRRPISRKAMASAVRGDSAPQGARATGAARRLAGGAGGRAGAGLAGALFLPHRPAPTAPIPQPIAAQTPPPVAPQAAPAPPITAQATPSPVVDALAPVPAPAAAGAPLVDEAVSIPASGAAAPVDLETGLEPLRAPQSAPGPVAVEPAQSPRDVLIERTPPEEARPPAFQAPLPPAGKGLVLLAKAGDTVPMLYRRVYRGLTPPPYAEVAAANPSVPRPGDLLVFPAPPNGWRN